jgi:hypothetical protein
MSESFKTIDLTSGEEVLQEALATSSGAADAGKIPALNGDGKLDETLLPTGIGAETIVAPSSESLGAGDYVNLWWDSGTRKVRLADADNGRPANGFVLAAVTSPANATVYPLGSINTQHSSLTPDTVYFLGTTAGDVTDDISAFGDGDIIQRIGLAISATEILTERNQPVTVASA